MKQSIQKLQEENKILNSQMQEMRNKELQNLAENMVYFLFQGNLSMGLGSAQFGFRCRGEKSRLCWQKFHQKIDTKTTFFKILAMSVLTVVRKLTKKSKQNDFPLPILGSRNVRSMSTSQTVTSQNIHFAHEHFAGGHFADKKCQNIFKKANIFLFYKSEFFLKLNGKQLKEKNEFFC